MCVTDYHETPAVSARSLTAGATACSALPLKEDPDFIQDGSVPRPGALPSEVGEDVTREVVFELNQEFVCASVSVCAYTAV